MKKQKNNKRQNPAVPAVPLSAAEEALLHDLSGESHADKPTPPALLLPEIPSPTVHGADTMASEEKAEEESAEDALLRALLQSAYPSPPEDLRKNVLTKVSVLAKRRRMRKAVVKWGSAAACFVMLCSLVIAANPMLRNSGTAAELAVADEAFASALYTAGNAAPSETPTETGAGWKAESFPSAKEPESKNEQTTEETACETVEETVRQQESGSTTDNSKPNKTSGATGNSKPNPSSGSTGNSTPHKSNGSTGNSTPNKTSGSTGDSTPHKSNGSTGNSTPNKTSGSTGDSTPHKSNGSTGNSTPNKTSGSTGNSAANKTDNANPAADSGTESETTKRTHPDLGAPVTRGESTETESVTPSTRHPWDGLPVIDASDSNASNNADTTNGANVGAPILGSSDNSVYNSGNSAVSETAQSVNNGALSEESMGNLAPAVDGNDSPAASEDTLDLSEFLEDSDSIEGTEGAEVSLMQMKAAPDPAVVAENQVKWALITYLAPEKYAKWMTENGYNTAADFTLPDLVSGMQIPHETFHAVVVMLGLEKQIDEGRFYREHDANVGNSAGSPMCNYAANAGNMANNTK